MANYVFVNADLDPPQRATSRTTTLELPITENNAVGFVQESPTIIIPQSTGIYQVSYYIEVQGTAIAGISAGLIVGGSTLLESVARIIPSSPSTVSNITSPATPTLNLTKSFMMNFINGVPIGLRITADTPFVYRIRRYNFYMTNVNVNGSNGGISNILMAQYIGPDILAQRTTLTRWVPTIDTGNNLDTNTGIYTVRSDGFYEIIAVFNYKAFSLTDFRNIPPDTAINIVINDDSINLANNVSWFTLSTATPALSSQIANLMEGQHIINLILDLRENDTIFFRYEGRSRGDYSITYGSSLNPIAPRSTLTIKKL